MGLESKLTLSGGPRGVCGVHRLIVDSLRDICEPSFPPPTSTPLFCISCLLISLLRLATASYLPINILSVTKRSYVSAHRPTNSPHWDRTRRVSLITLRDSEVNTEKHACPNVNI